MTLKWGSTIVTAVKWGSTNVTKVLWGSTVVWPDSAVMLASFTNYWTGYNQYKESESSGNLSFYAAYSANSGNTSTNSISTYARVTSGPAVFHQHSYVSGGTTYVYRGKAAVITDTKFDLTGKTSCTITCTATYTLNVNRSSPSLVISTSNAMSYTNGTGSSASVFAPSSYVVQKSPTNTTYCDATSMTFTWTNSLNGSYYIMYIQSGMSSSSGGTAYAGLTRTLTGISFS